MVGRFAPSPTGRMHLGNIYSAMLSWLSARSAGSEWILRIEDLDPQRSKMDYARQAEDDLRWMGLTWDRGGTADPLYIQSQRKSIYEEELQRLEAMGLTYPCFCTRADILATQAPHESDGRVVYAGTCRGLTPEQYPNRQPATRLQVEDADISFSDRHYGEQKVNLKTHCGDFVVRRADGAFAYQLAVVVDDDRMGVEEVVRGRDLLLSSAQQIWLYRLLGYPVPTFCHLPLLCNEAGQRLSKRDQSLDMGRLRARFTPEQILGRLAYYAGQTETAAPLSLSELSSGFCWDRVPREDIIVRDEDWA